MGTSEPSEMQDATNALLRRSLKVIETELKFLLETNIISEELSAKITVLLLTSTSTPVQSSNVDHSTTTPITTNSTSSTSTTPATTIAKTPTPLQAAPTVPVSQENSTSSSSTTPVTTIAKTPTPLQAVPTVPVSQENSTSSSSTTPVNTIAKTPTPLQAAPTVPVSQENSTSSSSTTPVTTIAKTPTPLQAAPTVPVSQETSPSNTEKSQSLSPQTKSQPEAPLPSCSSSFRPNPPFTVKALWPFGLAGDKFHGDLAFKTDQLIQVIRIDNENWWSGQLLHDVTGQPCGEVGMFPSSYVQICTPNGEKDLIKPAVPASQNKPTGDNMMVNVAEGSTSRHAISPPDQQEDKGKSKLAVNGNKFGRKLGNAAIFGAGATIGSRIVNRIF
ncbi:hypothetical protein BDZ91DRAFT_852619 [Kalaharituber pfeilii]|nr:hypothetical protein BDZ91DRAFT_852619 [Kalaharituber pfeilii]